MTRRRGACTILLALLPLLCLLPATRTATCNYPAWLLRAWFHNYDNNDITYVYEYKANGNIQQRLLGANVAGVNIYFQCKKEVQQPEHHWYGAEMMVNGNPTGHIQCMHIIRGDLVVLERPTKINSYSECPSVEVTTRGFNIMVAHPFSFTSGSCPFPAGTMQVTYNADSGSSNVCKDDPTSTVVISANTLEISTCVDLQNDYRSPYKATMQCVDKFDGDKVDSVVNGNVLILARTIYGKTYFYCARYKSLDGSIYMSMDVSDQNSPDCLPGATFTTYGLNDQSLYRSFVFSQLQATTKEKSATTDVIIEETSTTSIYGPEPTGALFSTESSFAVTSKQPEVTCNDKTCENGGSCINQSCLCPDGITGKFCQTKSEEVNSNDASLSQGSIIIIAIFCSLAVLITIIVIGSLIYCYVRNRQEEDKHPPELADDDSGMMFQTRYYTAGSQDSLVRTWTPVYRYSSQTSTRSANSNN